MKLATVIQTAGMASLTAGAALVDAALGFATAGVLLLLIGVAEERKQRAS